MSTIGGIGSYGGISLTGFRNKQSEEQGELAQLARNVEKTTRTANAESEREFRARQATEEGFARLRVALQNASDGKVETSVSSGRVEKPLGDEGGNAALEAFKAYMAMTPAEKMRDSSIRAGLFSTSGRPGLAAAARSSSAISRLRCSSSSLIRRRALSTSGCCSV